MTHERPSAASPHSSELGRPEHNFVAPSGLTSTIQRVPCPNPAEYMSSCLQNAALTPRTWNPCMCALRSPLFAPSPCFMSELRELETGAWVLEVHCMSYAHTHTHTHTHALPYPHAAAVLQAVNASPDKGKIMASIMQAAVQAMAPAVRDRYAAGLPSAHCIVRPIPCRPQMPPYLFPTSRQYSSIASSWSTCVTQASVQRLQFLKPKLGDRPRVPSIGKSCQLNCAFLRQLCGRGSHC